MVTLLLKNTLQTLKVFLQTLCVYLSAQKGTIFPTTTNFSPSYSDQIFIISKISLSHCKSVIQYYLYNSVLFAYILCSNSLLLFWVIASSIAFESCLVAFGLVISLCHSNNVQLQIIAFAQHIGSCQNSFCHSFYY